MILDVRTYKCYPGTINAQLDLYARKGAIPQIRHIGNPVLYIRNETGNPNEYIHIWAYKNHADREVKKANMNKDVEWLAYLKASAELGAITEQTNKLMTPCDFFPKPVLP